MLKTGKRYKTFCGRATILMYELLGTQCYGRVTDIKRGIFDEAQIGSTYWFTLDGKFGRDDYKRKHPLDLKLKRSKMKLPSWF